MTGLAIVVLLAAVVFLLSRTASLQRRALLLEENVIWLRARAEEALRNAASAARAETEPATAEPVVQPAEPVTPPFVETAPAATPTQPEPFPAEPFPQQEEPVAAFTVTPPMEDTAPFEPPQEAPQNVPFPAAAGSTVAPPPRPTFDWESLVGVKLFSWIAGVALVLAAVFFLKYSVEHGWLSPTIRATLGIVTGIALLVICETRVARGYAVTANALHGAGIAILYSSLFAIHALWHLLPSSVVFGLMLVVTAVAVLLSIRRDSVFIALLGLMGGFATPALLSNGENRPIGLFSYLLLLNLGLAWVAFRKGWTALALGSLVFTALYQWGWVGKYLTATQLPLAAAIFALFALVGTAAMWTRGLLRPDGTKRGFESLAVTSAVLPLAFAIFAAAVPAYGARYNVLFAFLLLLAAGLGVIALWRGPKWLHTIGGMATLLTFAIWISVSYKPPAWPLVLAWLSAFVVLYLLFALRDVTEAVYTAPLLLFLFPALAIIEKAADSTLTLFGPLLVLMTLIAAFAVWRRAGALFYVGVFVTIVTEGIWSARHLAPETLLAGLTVYGLFALLFLGTPVLARRLGRPLSPPAGTAATVLASIGMLFFLTTHAMAAASLWGLALLLAVMVIGLFVEARTTALPGAAIVAVVLSWIVLASWWSSAPLEQALIPALFLIALFGTIVVLGSVWAYRASALREFALGVHLVVVGHLFLMFVASQPALGLPPWPLFAVLLILDLAIGAAAIFLENGSLMVSGIVASQVVLTFWTAHAAASPWPAVALAATLIVAAWGIAWLLLAARTSFARGTFLAAAILGLLLAHVNAIVAGQVASTPIFWTLLGAHTTLVLTMIVLAWITEQHLLVVLAVPVAAIATALARTQTAGQELTFAAVFYGIFVAYPLLLGARTRKSFYPYLAAVFASVPFFFFARDAMLRWDLGFMMGALPVAQALVMIALLVRLLRIEPPGEREISRFALVAAAALAFITLAVPLQLDKQWITIAWALEAAALVWLFSRVPHAGLLAWSAALFAAVFVRLVINPSVFGYQPSSHVAILNWYFYAYVTCAASFYFGAWRWPRDRYRQTAAVLSAGGTVLLFMLLNIEIADFYSTGPSLAFNFFSSSLAEDLTYTMGWAVFAIGMLVAGIALRSRSARIAALLLLVVTILKCFLHDLARLGGLYRVGSLLGLAASLVVVGVLLQKFVMTRTARAEEAV